MNENQKILKNLRAGMYIAIIANISAGLLFLFSYIVTKNIWFLATFFLVIFAAIAFVIVTKRFERKMKNILEQTKLKSNAEK